MRRVDLGPDLAQAIQGTENTVIFLMPGKFARMAHNYMVLLHFHRFQGAAWRVSKNEGHRPEFNPTSKQSSVQRTGKMMNLWRSYLAILVIAGGALVASPVPAWEKTSWTKSGEFTLTIHLLPTHPLVPGRGLRFAIGLDDAPPQPVACDSANARSPAVSRSRASNASGFWRNSPRGRTRFPSMRTPDPEPAAGG